MLREILSISQDTCAAFHTMEKFMNATRLPHFLRFIMAFAVIISIGGCSSMPSPPAAALASFSGDRILSHIRVLSSDEFEGRGPGSKGEQLTIKYLEEQFTGQPASSPAIPMERTCRASRLLGSLQNRDMKFSFTGHGRTLEPKFQDDFVAWSKRVTRNFFH